MGSITSSFKSGELIQFKIYFKVSRLIRNPVFSLRMSDMNNVNLVTWKSNAFVKSPLPNNIEGDFSIIVTAGQLFIMNGVYTLSIGFSDGKEVLDMHMKFIDFEIHTARLSEKYNTLSKEQSSGSLVFSESKWKVHV